MKRKYNFSPNFYDLEFNIFYFRLLEIIQVWVNSKLLVNFRLKAYNELLYSSDLIKQ